MTYFGKGVSSLITVSFTIRIPLDIKTLTIPFQRDDIPYIIQTMRCRNLLNWKKELSELCSTFKTICESREETWINVFHGHSMQFNDWVVFLALFQQENNLIKVHDLGAVKKNLIYVMPISRNPDFDLFFYPQK